MRQNSKQLAYKLKLAVGQRTEIAVNIRTNNGLTNGARNVIKLVQLTDKVNGLVLFGFSLTMKMLVKRPEKKIENFIIDILKVCGHQ